MLGKEYVLEVEPFDAQSLAWVSQVNADISDED